MAINKFLIDEENGRDIFNGIPNILVPHWAGLILSRFDHYLKSIPTSVSTLYLIIKDESKWKQAHAQFTEIRTFHNSNPFFKPRGYLHLAETVAKVTYNASNESAPFDHDSGWHIPDMAVQVAYCFQDACLDEEVKSLVLLFERNKKFKTNIEAAKDYFIYKMIDDILWFEWDPIGIRGLAPRDEYQNYLPTIFKMQKSNSSRDEIAEQLLKFENENMGMKGAITECLKIADKIISINKTIV